MLCLPTAPFRNHKIVSDLLAAWRADNSARFSANESNFPIQFAFTLRADGYWDAILEDSPMITGNTRSQDIPKTYRPNGAIYLQTVDSLLKNKTFYIDAKPYIMANEDSIDINNLEDLKVAELLFKNRYAK